MSDEGPAGASDARRRGRRAATALVDELLGTLAGPTAGAGPAGPAADHEVPVDRWAAVAVESVTAVVRAAGRGTLDVDGPGPGVGLRLAAGETVVIRLRNRAASPAGGLRLHAGELRSSTGAVLPGGLRFAPEVVDDLPARSAVAVTVRPVLPDIDIPPGMYRGVVLVAGAPAAWLPVSVVVAR